MRIVGRLDGVDLGRGRPAPENDERDDPGLGGTEIGGFEEARQACLVAERGEQLQQLALGDRQRAANGGEALIVAAHHRVADEGLDQGGFGREWHELNS